MTSLTRRAVRWLVPALVPALVAALALGCTPAREHAVTPAPFLATAVLAPVALAAASSALQEKWLPRIATGDALLGAAFTEAVAKRDDAGLHAGEHGGAVIGRSDFVAIDS